MSTSDAYALSAAYSLTNGRAPVAVIALHGLGGDRHQPLGTFRDFGPDVAVLAPDQRAHGETFTQIDPARLTFPALADDIVALVRAVGLGDMPVYLAGISMGAAVALTLLRRSDLDVRGASLVRPAFGATPVPAHLALMPMIASLLRTRGPLDGAAKFSESLDYRVMQSESPAAARSLLEQFEKPQALERLARLTVIPAQLAYASSIDLEGIRVPVQVFGAHGDPVHPVALAHEWSELIPDATLVEVPSRDAEPEAYTSLIRAAVRRHARTSLARLPPVPR